MCKYFMLIATMIIFALFGCGGGKMEEPNVMINTISMVPKSSWLKLSSKRIYFGHQSVGYNIMEGVQDINKSNPMIKLNIVETKEKMVSDNGGVFVHGPVGKNGEPGTKLEDFKKRLDEGEKKQWDIALIKFCYVDVVKDTDIKALFSEYTTRMKILKASHPDILFVHITVPLVTDPPSIMSTIKNFFGRKESSCAENIIKNEYNKMLLIEYGGKEPVFDLARVESTRMDGTRVTCSKDGNTVFCLNPDFSSDGGHLNAVGRKVVAAHFLVLLAELAEKN